MPNNSCPLPPSAGSGATSPSSFPRASTSRRGDYSKLQIIGDRELAASASLWHLGRLATNAMLYLNRPRPDLWGSLTMFNSALSDTNRTEIYDCGCDEVDWNIDWDDATLRPGRWRVVEEGGEGKPPFKVEWIPPRVVFAPDRDSLEKNGAIVLEFKARKRTKNEPAADKTCRSYRMDARKLASQRYDCQRGISNVHIGRYSINDQRNAVSRRRLRAYRGRRVSPRGRKTALCDCPMANPWVRARP